MRLTVRVPLRNQWARIFHFMTTKKPTKKPASKKAVKSEPAKTAKALAAKKPSKTAKKLAESKPVKKPVRRPVKPAEPEPVKLLAVENSQSNVTVNTTKPDAIELDKAKAAGLVVEAPNSITPEQAEKISESRVTHEDERPPNSEPELQTIAEQAWHNVKGEGDPELKNCVFTHQEKFQHHANGILKNGSPMSGDTLLARFEREVARLNKETN
jgi:hypothetical protein